VKLQTTKPQKGETTTTMTAAYDWTPEISNLSNELTGLKMPPPTPAAEHHIRSLRTSFDSTSARGMPVDESSGSSTEAYVFLSILAVLLLSAIVCAEFMSRRSNHRSEEQKEEEEERENEDRQKMVDSLESRKVTLVSDATPTFFVLETY
jgi:hypothetical protein